MGLDLSSEMRARFADPAIPAVVGRNAYIVGIEGVTERGPFGPHLVQSWGEFKKLYGGFTANADVALAVWNYFAEVKSGSKFLWINRIVHRVEEVNQSVKASVTLQTASLAATAGRVTGSLFAPYALADGDTIICAVDGGEDKPATFNAAAAVVQNGADEVWIITDGMTLTVKIDQGAEQTVTFVTGEFTPDNATAEEVAAVINAKLRFARATVTGEGKRVTITSDTLGTGSYVEVTGGTANDVLLFSTDEVRGTGDAVDADAITIAELKTLIEADIKTSSPGDLVTVTDVGGAVSIATNTLGAGGSIQVKSDSTADDELGLDNAVHAGSAAATLDTLKLWGKTDGTYAHSIKPRVVDATNGTSGYFNLQVELAGVVVENWKNLTMDSTSDDYVETVLNHAENGSDYLAAEDLDAATTDVLARPANGLGSYLSGGDDGLTSLADADYTGDSDAETGLYAFKALPTLDILLVPGRATSAVQNAMVTYCESDRDGKCFAILDPPASYDKSAIATYVASTAALLGLSQKAAMYWPRPRISNPNKAIFGNTETIAVPPSGLIAGLCARIAAESKKVKFDQPAGITWPLYSVRGFEGEDELRRQKHEVTKKEVRDYVFLRRINMLRKDDETPYYVDLEFTLKAGSGRDFPTVGEQLGAQWVAKSIESSWEVVRHRDNDATTREECRSSADVFLRELTDRGCFKSRDYAQAYVIDVGTGLNDPQTIKQYKLKAYVGLATNDPILYGDIEIAKDTRAYDAAAA